MPKLRFDSEAAETFVVFDGERIAKRGYSPARGNVIHWDSLKPGWTVVTTADLRKTRVVRPLHADDPNGEVIADDFETAVLH